MIDLTGQKFTRLTVIKIIGRNKYNQIQWLCIFECGTEIIVPNSGYKKSKVYMSWDGIIQRCTNPNFRQYKDYGGRGITVCRKWLKFENFLKDMGDRPKNYSLDRINNNGNYCKSNCR